MILNGLTKPAYIASIAAKGLCALKEDSSNNVLNFDTKLLHITASIIYNSLTHLFNLSSVQALFHLTGN